MSSSLEDQLAAVLTRAEKARTAIRAAIDEERMIERERVRLTRLIRERAEQGDRTGSAA